MDSERASTFIGSNGPRFEFIYHDDTIYEDWISFRFILMHKGIFVITQDCIEDDEQGLWFELID